MKVIFLFTSMVLVKLLPAQSFIEMSQNPPFDGVLRGAVAFADVDGDNDLDVLISGQSASSTALPVSALYTNDGLGTFTEHVENSFVGVSRGAIAFADVDGDNDQDLLLTGQDELDLPISTLYINDGGGTFEVRNGTSFEAVSFSSAAFADVDGDFDQDVLIAGWTDSGRISKLYLNDGTSNFTEKTGTPFEGVDSGSIAFADVDGDNDQDVLLTGWTGSERISKLYTNDGAGNFMEKIGTPFDGVLRGAIAFADIDIDNDQDLLITGELDEMPFPPLAVQMAKLYTNDGSGNFTEIIETPFEGVSYSSIAFSDVDGDNDQDVLITGLLDQLPLTTLYINDGGGTFSEKMGVPFDSVCYSAIAFADVDGDEDQDVLITGWNGFRQISTLYENTQGLSSLGEFINGSGIEMKLYPNPSASHKLNIEFDTVQHGVVEIKLFDLHGRIKSQGQKKLGIGAQGFDIDISALPSGRYVIQLDHGKQRGSAIFTVQ